MNLVLDCPFSFFFFIWTIVKLLSVLCESFSQVNHSVCWRNTKLNALLSVAAKLPSLCLNLTSKLLLERHLKKLFNSLEDILKMIYNWSVWNTFHWICLKIAFNWIYWMHFLFRTIWLFFSTSTTLKLHVVKILRMIIIRINLKSLIKSTLKKNIPTTIMLMLRTPRKPAASSRASCSGFSFSTSPPWSAPSCSWSFPSGFDGFWP